jgi:hypothetical protein
MNWIIILILIFIIVITPLAIEITQIIEKPMIEGYTDGFTYCDPEDQDYNSPNSCYDISYNDSSGKKKPGKARIYGNYYISYDGYLKKVPDKTLYIPSDNKIGYGPKGTNGITICETGDPNYNKPSVCTTANYYDSHKNKVTAPVKLSNRVYLDASGFVQQVPYGNKSNAQHNGYNPVTNSDIYSSAANSSNIKNNDVPSGTGYNTNNFDITYHDDPTGKGSPDDSQAGPGKMWVKDSSGNLVAIPYSDVSNTTLYYQPDSYRFGPSNYVPNYEESVYLSKLTNEPTTTPIIDAPYLKAGFCDENKHFPNKIEEKCNTLDTDTCASTKCCVLLGGQKCVAGSENGPTKSSNYSNFKIKNRDYYYYQGKCYGNCKK